VTFSSKAAALYPYFQKNYRRWLVIWHSKTCLFLQGVGVGMPKRPTFPKKKKDCQGFQAAEESLTLLL